MLEEPRADDGRADGEGQEERESDQERHEPLVGAAAGTAAEDQVHQVPLQPAPARPAVAGSQPSRGEDVVRSAVGRARRGPRPPARPRADDRCSSSRSCRSPPCELAAAVVRLERGAHRGDGAVHPRLRGPDRDVKGVRDLRDEQVRGSSGGRARPGGPVPSRAKPRSSRSRPRPTARARWRSAALRDDPQLDDRSAPLASGLPVAGADDEATEPGVDAIDVAKAADVPPGGDQGLLDGIVGAIAVAQDQAGDGIQSADRPVDEHGEGVMIACPARSARSCCISPLRPARRRSPCSQGREIRMPDSFRLGGVPRTLVPGRRDASFVPPFRAAAGLSDRRSSCRAARPHTTSATTRRGRRRSTHVRATPGLS